jgi:hypothetical protein
VRWQCLALLAQVSGRFDFTYLTMHLYCTAPTAMPCHGESLMVYYGSLITAPFSSYHGFVHAQNEVTGSLDP